MRWVPLARNEARTIIKSKPAWLLVPLIILWGFRPTYAGWDALGSNITVGYLQIGASVFLPLAGLLLGYQSIIGERTSGSIKFLLALPLTRPQLLLAKAVGRMTGVAVIVFVGLLGLAVVGLIEHGPFSVLLFVGTALATLLFVATIVSIAVAISAVVKRTVVAAATVFGFFLATLSWAQIVPAVYSAITSVPAGPSDPPGIVLLLLRLTPNGAYNVLTNWMFGVGNSAEIFEFVYIKHLPNVFINAYVVDTTFSPDAVPWYLHPGLSIVILLAWLIVPLGLARFAFDRGDAL